MGRRPKSDPTNDAFAGRNEKFVVAWQRADSVDEVAKVMGWEAGRCGTHASQMRAHGVPLKRFRAARSDYAALAQLARRVSAEAATA